MPLPMLLDQIIEIVLDENGDDKLFLQAITREGPIYKQWPDPLYAATTDGERGFGNTDALFTLTTTSKKRRTIDKLTPMTGYLNYNEWGIYPNRAKFQRYMPGGTAPRGRLQRDQNDTTQPWFEGKDLRWYPDTQGHLDDKDSFYTINVMKCQGKNKSPVKRAATFEAYNDTGATITPRLIFATWMFKVKVIDQPQKPAYRRFYLPPIGGEGGLDD